jgi:hypothetical protein
MTEYGGAEDLVVDRVERFQVILIPPIGFRQRMIARGIELRRGLEIEPEEDAPASVPQHRPERGLAQSVPLPVESRQVDLFPDGLR